MKKEREPFVRALTSTARYTRLLIPGEQAVCLKSGLVVLQPREAVGEHSTDSREEVLVILQGKAGIALNGDKALEAGAGTLVYIPEHTVHNVTNRGSGILRYIFIVTPV